MNYMLPLYLDYLERPHIYEGLMYKKLGILRGSISEDIVIRIRNKINETVSNYSKKKAAYDVKKILKRTSKKKAPVTKMKLQASHATKRSIADLKALNKKTQTLGKTTKAGTTVKTAAKKVIPKVPIPKIVPGIKTATPKVGTALKKMGGKAAMVAGGAAAAYGGYKLYKRHFSKAAKKCKGKSGAERTLCLQQATRS